MKLPVARLVPATRVEGPFTRTALWTAGCALACPGCCNPELFLEAAGVPRAIEELEQAILRARATHGTEGLTFVGGEPTRHLEAVTELARRLQSHGLGIILFSGHRRAELEERPGFARLWATIDTLVDGRFDARRPEPPTEHGGRRFLGSRNQQLWHRTSRYAAPELWRGENRAEVHIDPTGRVSVVGFPTEVRRIQRALAGHDTVHAGRLARRERDDPPGPA